MQGELAGVPERVAKRKVVVNIPNTNDHVRKGNMRKVKHGMTTIKIELLVKSKKVEKMVAEKVEETVAVEDQDEVGEKNKIQ